MRRHLRLFVVALIVLFVGAVAWLVARQVWEQRKRDVVFNALEMLPGVSQHIQNFRRIKVQDGRTVWEVSAEDARYLEAEKIVVIRRALVKWFLKDGRVVGMQGDEGRIVLDGREVSRVELRGGIEVTFGDYVARTDNAVYDHAGESISAPGSVEIASSTVQAKGDGMRINVAAQSVSLLRNVVTRFRSATPTSTGGSHGTL